MKKAIYKEIITGLILLSILIYSYATINNKNKIIDNLIQEIESLRDEKELDPCPVCDGHNTHIYYDDMHDISIKCEDCGTTFGFYQDLNDALAIWNNVKG